MELGWMLIVSHLLLAILLFFLVNWIGEHAVDFGYASTTLFEEPNESIALNFFIRAMSPAVFTIALAALVVTAGYPSLRLGLYWVAVFYYVVRAAAIFILNREHLISWTRFIGHAAIGILAAVIAYRYLIVPNQSLVPNVADAGNELWLAILAFLYAVANKVPLSGGPGARRRNRFIRLHYERAATSFGHIVNEKVENSLLKLIVYSILVYEDYARPPAIRSLERMMFWKSEKSTGVMQVKSTRILTDEESVGSGIDILSSAWNRCSSEEENLYSIIYCTIREYNPDYDYISKVLEVMDIVARRVDPRFRPDYVAVFGEAPAAI